LNIWNGVENAAAHPVGKCPYVSGPPSTSKYFRFSSRLSG
jgi:hypothetical protein